MAAPRRPSRWVGMLAGIALLALLVYAPVAVRAQSGNTVTIRFPGVPSGSCSPVSYAVDDATGDFYDCSGGAWNKVGGESGASIGGTVTSSHLTYASGSDTIANVAGSAVTGATGAIALTAGAITTTPLAIAANSSSQTADLLTISADGTTPNCAALVSLPSALCVGSNGDLSNGITLLAPASSAAGSALSMILTGGTAQEGFLLERFQGATTQSGGTDISDLYNNVGGAYIVLNDDYSIGLYAGGPCGDLPAGADPWIWWGYDGPDTYIGGIQTCTGELALGTGLTGKTGGTYLSIVDGSSTYKVDVKNPGTLSANYNFNLPIAAGTSGQFLTSGGGGTAPMTWTSGATLFVASLTTTAATSDNVSITGATSSSHCWLQPTNASADTLLSGTYVSAKTTNQITVTHAATSGATFDVGCTAG